MRDIPTPSEGQTIYNAQATSVTDSYSLSGLTEICLDINGAGFTGSIAFTCKPISADVATPIGLKNIATGTIVSSVSDFSSRIRLQLLIPIICKQLIIAITRSAGSVTIKKWTK